MTVNGLTYNDAAIVAAGSDHGNRNTNFRISDSREEGSCRQKLISHNELIGGAR